MEKCLRGKKPRIRKIVMLFSMSFLPHQGRYLRVYNQAKTLVDAGKDITIIAWDRDCISPKKEVIDGIKIERIWSRAGFQLGPLNIFSVIIFYLRLIPRLFKKEVDIIHCFNLDTVFPGLFVARFLGKKAILDMCEPEYYTNWPKRYYPLVWLLQMFERFFSKRFDYLLVHNLFQVRKFTRYGIKALEQIGSYPNQSLILDKIKEMKGNTVVIGRIGSIYKNNGVEEMIDAFRKLSEVTPNVKLLFAGKVFKEFLEDFNRLISPFGDAIEIIGKFSSEDLPKLYNKIDVSLQLSRRTDWFKNITPTKFFESLANGVPVVTSDIGDLRQIIDEKKCGIIVDEMDIESVFSGLKRLVEDHNLRVWMAENGLRAIKESYNWELMGKRLLEVYQVLDSAKAEVNSANLSVGKC